MNTPTTHEIETRLKAARKALTAVKGEGTYRVYAREMDIDNWKNIIAGKDSFYHTEAGQDYRKRNLGRARFLLAYHEIMTAAHEAQIAYVEATIAQLKRDGVKHCERAAAETSVAAVTRIDEE